jgi:hypothetical protein
VAFACLDKNDRLPQGLLSWTRANETLSSAGLERRKPKATCCVVAQDEIDRGIAEVAASVVKDDRMSVHIASLCDGSLTIKD